MTTLQLTAQKEHKCEDCKKTIAVGESMIRAEHRASTCGGSYAVYWYHHLKCWPKKQEKRSRR